MSSLKKGFLLNHPRSVYDFHNGLVIAQTCEQLLNEIHRISLEGTLLCIKCEKTNHPNKRIFKHMTSELHIQNEIDQCKHVINTKSNDGYIFNALWKEIIVYLISKSIYWKKSFGKKNTKTKNRKEIFTSKYIRNIVIPNIRIHLKQLQQLYSRNYKYAINRIVEVKCNSDIMSHVSEFW